MSSEYKLCACPLDCFDVCSIRAEIIDGKVTKLTGNKEHPITQGFICEKGRKHAERMYSPLRLKKPMKKVNGGFVEITWDEALDTIAGKLKHYINEYGTLSIAQYNDGGAAGLLKNIENLFFDYLGAVTQFEGNLCWGAGMAAQKLDFGDVKGHAPEDIENAKTIIIWGRNIVETNMHMVPFVKKAKEKGTKVIVIDPITTATTAISDWHIKLKPKGDAAFACAVAKYMIENKLFDHSFVYNYTKGFHELSSYIRSLSYKELLKLCGTNMDTVIGFAGALIHKPAAIYIGYGLQRYKNGGSTVRSIDMLGALAGIIGISGGGVNYANKVYGSFIDWESAAPTKEPEHRYISKPRFAADLAGLDNPKVKMLFISRSNPVVQQPDAAEVAYVIKGIEFKVVLDHFMTDTAKLADIVLPVTYFMEETDIIYSSMWNSYMFYNEKLIPRNLDVKPEFEIYSILAQKLDMTDFPQMKEEQWIDKLLSKLYDKGLNASELKRNSFTKINVNPIAWENKEFSTQSGRFEFIDNASLKSCITDEQSKTTEDFRLLTVHAKESLHSQHFLTSEVEHPPVYISSKDALRLEINNNELVQLYNEYGCITAEAVISDKGQSGVLFMHEGWWKKNGGSVNSLTPHDNSDIGLQAVYNDCICKIRKQGA